MKKKTTIKPKQTKTAKKSKRPSAKLTANGVKVGDRVYCAYQGTRFKHFGTVVARFRELGANYDRLFVLHDAPIRVMLPGCWIGDLPIESLHGTPYGAWTEDCVFKLVQ